MAKMRPPRLKRITLTKKSNRPSPDERQWLAAARARELLEKMVKKEVRLATADLRADLDQVTGRNDWI
jgi:hypothetical protein